MLPVPTTTQPAGPPHSPAIYSTKRQEWPSDLAAVSHLNLRGAERTAVLRRPGPHKSPLAVLYPELSTSVQPSSSFRSKSPHCSLIVSQSSDWLNTEPGDSEASSYHRAVIGWTLSLEILQPRRITEQWLAEHWAWRFCSLVISQSSDWLNTEPGDSAASSYHRAVIGWTLSLEILKPHRITEQWLAEHWAWRFCSVVISQSSDWLTEPGDSEASSYHRAVIGWTLSLEILQHRHITEQWLAEHWAWRFCSIVISQSSDWLNTEPGDSAASSYHRAVIGWTLSLEILQRRRITEQWLAERWAWRFCSLVVSQSSDWACSCSTT